MVELTCAFSAASSVAFAFFPSSSVDISVSVLLVVDVDVEEEEEDVSVELMEIDGSGDRERGEAARGGDEGDEEPEGPMRMGDEDEIADGDGGTSERSFALVVLEVAVVMMESLLII